MKLKEEDEQRPQRLVTGEMLLYQTEDDQTRLEVRLQQAGRP